MVRQGGLRWFEHLERKSRDDWVSACRKVEEVGEKTWRECVNDDMKVLNLFIYFLLIRHF